MQKIQSLVEARKEFATKEQCEAHLTRMRWPDGVTCPRCGSKEVTFMERRRKWQCRCRYQFSATSGTFMHGTHIDLPRWMMAIWLMCHSPKGISSKQIERELGLTYKSASRDGDVKLKILSKLKGEEVRRVVAQNVDYVKSFYTDGHKLYRRMHELGPHQYVVHQKQWVDGEVHVSFVENAWSLFKRSLIGVFHHVSTKYLQHYLDEFCFRYRHRHEKARLMDLVLASC